jgi:hypothetical protein
MADTRRELILRGPPSPALMELIRSRFEVSAPDGESPVLILEGLDQAAVRALLTLLWDAGHEVVSMTPLRPGRRDWTPS